MTSTAAEASITALGFGAIAAGLAKLVWFRDLKPVPWWRLARAVMLASAAVLVIGAAVAGRDGRMSTYAAMVVVGAATLMWAGRRA
ncbi:MAG: hypothetical protein EPO01_04245 [Aquabacterium sp.]|nr:MAG: hypothetical protein EPO01_04245 [Aquabacterium sp.]